MSKAVLDASAVLAVLRNERGAENVIPHLRGSLISSINYAEVLCILREGGGDPEMGELAINGLQIERVAFDSEHAQLVASIYTRTLGTTIGLADRACLSLGLKHGLPVITSDSDWRKVDIGVDVQLFRERKVA